MSLIEMGQAAQAASLELGVTPTNVKNNLLEKMATALITNVDLIIEANQADLKMAKEAGMAASMLDRLRLTTGRIQEMAAGIEQVASLADPIGEVEKMWVNADDLTIGKKRVPLGVIGIIYEARPNVTTDAAALCFKSGNAVILRGGKEAFHSNQALVKIMQNVLKNSAVPETAIQFVPDTSRETATELMQLDGYLDVLIPRGGAGLIQSVLKNATVPVIETGTGNCHIYVDEAGQFKMAQDIIINAKCQRPSVCNAVETVLVHEAIAAEFLPLLEKDLLANGVEIRADELALNYLTSASLATELDWQTEYNDLILAIKVVPSLTAAIQHINQYNSKHSEAIITDNYFASQNFLARVDAAAVYVNASTRFTDGFVFGFGAEIGISNQKLHARGPMGLNELTSIKYIIYGEGQVRQ